MLGVLNRLTSHNQYAVADLLLSVTDSLSLSYDNSVFLLILCSHLI